MPLKFICPWKSPVFYVSIYHDPKIYNPLKKSRLLHKKFFAPIFSLSPHIFLKNRGPKGEAQSQFSIYVLGNFQVAWMGWIMSSYSWKSFYILNISKYIHICLGKILVAWLMIFACSNFPKSFSFWNIFYIYTWKKKKVW